jgi:carbamoyl-phosphate synthase large subunit
MGVPAKTINKIGEGSPHVVDCIEQNKVDLVINTPVGTGARADGYEIRSAAVARGIPCITTMAGGIAAARAISAARRGEPDVLSLQEVHGRAAPRQPTTPPATTA